MSEKLQKMCVEFVNGFDNIDDVTHEQSFAKGFELGMKMMLNIVCDNETSG